MHHMHHRDPMVGVLSIALVGDAGLLDYFDRTVHYDQLVRPPDS